MWDLVGNPEDRFCHCAAQLCSDFPLFQYNSCCHSEKSSTTSKRNEGVLICVMYLRCLKKKKKNTPKECFCYS